MRESLQGRTRINPSGESAASESKASSFEEDGSWEFANCGRHWVGRRFRVGLEGASKPLPKFHGIFVTKKIGWLENIT